jgi:hypothetical protein
MKSSTSLSEKIRLFFRNVNMLTTFDLREMEWHNHMAEKTLRGLSQYMQMQGPAKDLLLLPKLHTELNKHEYRIFSQTGEDGILLWILSQIGVTTNTFVEFGIGSGRECIVANLVLNYGWHGLMMDGSKQNIASAKSFFKYLMSWPEYEKLDIRKEFVTKENINSLIESSSAAKGADILSIDIDGNDYWVWEAITVIDPRIVVIEYNATFGATRSVTVPYKADFDAYKENPLGLYHGASLEALVRLAKNKGYRFIGCNSFGVNAFFVKESRAGSLLASTAKQAFYDNGHKLKRGSQTVQFEAIKDKSLVEIL